MNLTVIRPIESEDEDSPFVIAGLLEIDASSWRAKDAEPELESRLSRIYADSVRLSLEVYDNNGEEFWSWDIIVAPGEDRYMSALQRSLGRPYAILECIPPESLANFTFVESPGKHTA